MKETSATGWLLLCETCCSQTATVLEDGRYLCEQCFEGGDEEIEVDDEEEEIACDCGAIKTNTTHSSWCSTSS